MSTTRTAPAETRVVATLHEAAASLASEVRRVAASGRYGGPAIQRIAVPAPRLDPVDWLSAREPGTRGLWSPRHENTLTAHWGVADSYECEDEVDYDRLAAYVHHMLEGADDDVRYMGGLRFDARRVPDALWEPFGTSRFVLPRFEYALLPRRSELACNLVWPHDRRSAEAIAAACEGIGTVAEDGTRDLPLPVSRTDDPARPEWLRRVSVALGAIDDRSLQKVVLARHSTFGFADPVDALHLFRALREATPNRFHFYFEAADGRAFLGASPERLLRREEAYLFSEAVAGSKPRVADAAGDEALRSDLLQSDKEQREHLSVRWAIEETLRPFCELLSVDARATEMRLAQGRHLVSRFEGVLRAGVSSWDLLRHLHPTPATGGYPGPAALKAIRRAEGFDRGWYAGPVGCVGREFAEFAVALRCGLVVGSDLHLYSGAGIVLGSEPEAEWDEIEHKIADFVRALRLAPDPV
jgi:menaquinone-specific isochorismate synthase